MYLIPKEVYNMLTTSGDKITKQALGSGMVRQLNNLDVREGGRVVIRNDNHHKTIGGKTIQNSLPPEESDEDDILGNRSMLDRLHNLRDGSHSNRVTPSQPTENGGNGGQNNLERGDNSGYQGQSRFYSHSNIITRSNARNRRNADDNGGDDNNGGGGDDEDGNGGDYNGNSRRNDDDNDNDNNNDNDNDNDNENNINNTRGDNTNDGDHDNANDDRGNTNDGRNDTINDSDPARHDDLPDISLPRNDQGRLASDPSQNPIYASNQLNNELVNSQTINRPIMSSRIIRAPSPPRELPSTSQSQIDPSASTQVDPTIPTQMDDSNRNVSNNRTNRSIPENPVSNPNVEKTPTPIYVRTRSRSPINRVKRRAKPNPSIIVTPPSDQSESIVNRSDRAVPAIHPPLPIIDDVTIPVTHPLPQYSINIPESETIPATHPLPQNLDNASDSTTITQILPNQTEISQVNSTDVNRSPQRLQNTRSFRDISFAPLIHSTPIRRDISFRPQVHSTPITNRSKNLNRGLNAPKLPTLQERNEPQVPEIPSQRQEPQSITQKLNDPAFVNKQLADIARKYPMVKLTKLDLESNQPKSVLKKQLEHINKYVPRVLLDNQTQLLVDALKSKRKTIKLSNDDLRKIYFDSDDEMKAEAENVSNTVGRRFSKRLKDREAANRQVEIINKKYPKLKLRKIRKDSNVSPDDYLKKQLNRISKFDSKVLLDPSINELIKKVNSQDLPKVLADEKLTVSSPKVKLKRINPAWLESIPSNKKKSKPSLKISPHKKESPKKQTRNWLTLLRKQKPKPDNKGVKRMRMSDSYYEK